MSTACQRRRDWLGRSRFGSTRLIRRTLTRQSFFVAPEAINDGNAAMGAGQGQRLVGEALRRRQDDQGTHIVIDRVQTDDLSSRPV